MAGIKGGEKLERALAELSRNVTSAATLRVGFLENATYPDGTKVALVAAVNNFGAPSRGIPPRPFFTNMVADRSGEWPAILAEGLKKNRYDATAALTLTGEFIRSHLQQAIRDFSGVPLAASTVARKGFSKQLISTAHMLNSVDYEVK
jgi:hypothetical protein